ncbi:MAG: hypothetical protein AB7Q29_11295 [Vicinamibacterales bacterium]
MVTSSLVRRTLVVVAAMSACAGALLQASTPKFFEAATQSDFLRGEIEGLAIDSRGQLTLGPASDTVFEAPSAFVWTVLPASDGSAYVGTGNDGRVYRIDAQGRSAVFFDAAELGVHALAPAPNGGIYAATSPDGKIYRIDRNGSATTFFDPDEKYIWALVGDAKGVLYAATGDGGIVYRISPDGTGSRFYDTKATHASALALDASGNLLIGTESPGRVLRVDASGRGFLLLDTPYQEIRSLRVGTGGRVFVAAANGRPNTGAAPQQPQPANTPEQTGGASGPAPTASVSVSTEITAVVIDQGNAPAANQTRAAVGQSKGAVYRVEPNGLWDLLWDSREDLPYDLAVEGEALVVGTGDKGKIYRLEGDPLRATLIARAPAQQVTSLYREPGGRLLFATANPGKISRLSADHASTGVYQSEVQDAQIVSAWGTIMWRGTTAAGTRIDVSTRSGNTEAPDDTWSAWSAPYAASGAQIASPNARFLQWRATLGGSSNATPTLTSVTAAYLPRNLRPQVRSVTVHQPGIVFQKPYSTGDPDLAGFDNQTTPERRLTLAAQTAQQGSSLGRRTYQKGLQTLQWRADDENDDELAYEVQYRREGETAWTTLREGLTDTILVWDTTMVPNGTYFVRVIASDAPSNASNQTLAGELESAAFDIDNTPPSFSQPRTRVDSARTIVDVDVRDDYSPIQRVEYSVDGMTWTAVFPADGIADSKAESYAVSVEGGIGPRGLTLRAIDALNNVATTQVPAQPATGSRR